MSLTIMNAFIYITCFLSIYVVEATIEASEENRKIWFQAKERSIRQKERHENWLSNFQKVTISVT